jgi:hypothetical protein
LFDSYDTIQCRQSVTKGKKKVDFKKNHKHPTIIVQVRIKNKDTPPFAQKLLACLVSKREAVLKGDAGRSESNVIACLRDYLPAWFQKEKKQGRVRAVLVCACAISCLLGFRRTSREE